MTVYAFIYFFQNELQPNKHRKNSNTVTWYKNQNYSYTSTSGSIKIVLKTF